jgi:hypothetical protein
MISLYRSLKLGARKHGSSKSVLTALQGTLDHFNVTLNRDACAEGLLRMLAFESRHGTDVFVKDDRDNQALLTTFDEFKNRLDIRLPKW